MCWKVINVFAIFAFKFLTRNWQCPRQQAVKAIGGGSEVKILILHVSGSKFSVLSPPFYGIQKFGSVGPKFPDLSGRVGAPEGHFSLFGAIWWPNDDKFAWKCPFIGLKLLIMFKEVFQKVKTSDFVTYWQSGASYHNPIIIVFSYQFSAPPKKLWPHIGYSGYFRKNRISQKWS